MFFRMQLVFVFYIFKDSSESMWFTEFTLTIIWKDIKTFKVSIFNRKFMHMKIKKIRGNDLDIITKSDESVD
jgi:hypothetical protein